MNPYGGINFVINQLQNQKIANLIDTKLGKRVAQATYSYSDILLYWIYSNICGAERLEDTVHVKSQLDSIPNLANPSPDRISGVLRSLAKDKITYEGSKGKKHEFCINKQMNELMVDVAIKLKTIKSKCLDYDNVIIETEKYDSRWTYSEVKGYQPGVAFLGDTPVYIEGRNGNSPAVYKMTETLERCLDLLEEKKVPVKYFRSDSASYQYDICRLMDERGIEFFIRAEKSPSLLMDCKIISDWQKVSFGNMYYEVGETEFTPFDSKKRPKAYRTIVSRIKDENGDYAYYAIMTSNKSMSKIEVLRFYNQRGSMERHFDDLKNNFNWKRIPFSYLNENLVFLILGAIAKIAYTHVVTMFSKKVDFVKSTWRLKKFIFRFITVSSIWENDQLTLFTEQNYHKIFR